MANDKQKQAKIAQFDPNGLGLKNGHFIGLPFEEEDAAVVLLPVPWDVTVSYAAGTATGPANILEASSQLDLYDPDVPDAWQLGIYMRMPDEEWLARSQALRPQAKAYIDFLEEGGQAEAVPAMKASLAAINAASAELNAWVRRHSGELHDAGKMVGVVGGEHSVPLGLLQALGERYPSFGILQIDAHADLRPAYEGFTYSHASIAYNALSLPSLSQLTQVGIRDCCEAEVALAADDERIHIFYEQDIRRRQFRGESWAAVVKSIVETLPELVYVSFDIDGLQPHLCPNTGTPVPGGLNFEEAIFLLQEVVASGRRIIGFDLCETAGLGNEWDGSVGARVLYRLCNLAAEKAI